MQNDFYPFRIGSFECVALCDGDLDYSLESMVKNAPRADVETYLQAHGLRTDVINTPFTYLYVDTGKHKILVDMGAGNLFPSTGRLLQSMTKAGISPESIESVFISHAHPDHVGGALNEQDELIIVNAMYYICQNEWDFWFSEEAIKLVDESFISFARKKLTPLKERMLLIEKEKEILPGVDVIFAPGHTPGHMVISFRSEGEQVLYIGDNVLHPLHLERPDWLPIFDILPELAGVSKDRIFDLAATTRSLVLGQHFPPFPNLGYIVKKEIGWLWQPLETAS